MSTVLDDVWQRAVGGLDWLKQVVLGEFDDSRDMSAVIADMLISFVPGVIIVTSARDLTAVIVRLAKHPEKREDVEEWMLLVACVIPLILPILAAAAGAVAAGVGAVVGGIGGSEAGAALRATCLLLIKGGAEILAKLVEFLRTFLKGDILAVLRDIKFVRYGEALAHYTVAFIGKLRVVVQRVAAEVARLSWFSSAETVLKKLQALEHAFYAVQTSAIKKIPLALAELDARLTKALAEEMKPLEHPAHTAIPAPKPVPVPPKPARVPAMPDNGLGTPPGTTAPGDLPPATDRTTNLHPQTAKVELHRPYIRKAVRAEVEARAPRTADGRFIDPNTHQPIDGPYDLGHVPGHEFRTEKAEAEAEGLTQQEFNDRMNNPDYYQIEDPSSNRSHKVRTEGLTMDELFVAIARHDRASLEKLLIAGRDANTLNEDGRTGLMRAAIKGFVDLMQLLITHGADVNLQDKGGYTALHYAAQDYHPEAIELLCRSGAAVDPVDGYGNTPLGRAVMNSRGRGEAIRILLAMGRIATGRTTMAAARWMRRS